MECVNLRENMMPMPYTNILEKRFEPLEFRNTADIEGLKATFYSMFSSYSSMVKKYIYSYKNK